MKPQHPAVKRIVTAVAKKYGLNASDILGTSRTKTLAEARMLCYLLAKESLSWSYPEFGLAFERDQSTIVEGIRRIRQLLEIAHPDHLIRKIYDSFKMGVVTPIIKDDKVEIKVLSGVEALEKELSGL